MLKFPYAIREFEKLIKGGFLYLDRTHYIPFIEDWGFELLFLRPRRFGKSLWLSTLMNYYDISKADDFEQLFGHLAIGKEPTTLHNSYLVMRWDFSRVSAQGSIGNIQEDLNRHINDRIERFAAQYQEQLNLPIRIDPIHALSSFESLMTATDLSGYKLYLFIDEYDNFANEVMMSTQDPDPERYLTLVKGEGMFKTFFKNLKSAGSGDGLDRVFMTGVSPIVLNDVTSGANVFQDISWHPRVNELCGFSEVELQNLTAQIIEYCELPETYVQEIMIVMQNNYNGSRFIDDYYLPTESPKVYNPTLSFHFLKGFQTKCSYPKHLIDQNLVPDSNKLAYIADYTHGKELLENALEQKEIIAVSSLRERFGVKDLANPNLRQERLAVLLCYLGGLTSVGEEPSGEVILEIPNLVMRRLYGERVLMELTENDEAKIKSGHRAANRLFMNGHMQPLCDFVEEHFFSIYANRDAKDFRELTLKTLFITLLYHTQMYLIDSERELNHRYSDLLMLVRPDLKKRGLQDILIEFKQLPLKKVTEEQDGTRRSLDGETVKARSEDNLMALENVKKEFDEAEKQLNAYRQALIKKHGLALKLRCYAVVGLGFARILWKEI